MQHSADEIALVKFQYAVDERIATLGANDPVVTDELSNLGNLVVDKGVASGARLLLEGALALREQQHGPDDPEVATDLGNLVALETLCDLEWDVWTAPNGDGFGARLETYLTDPRSEPDPSHWKSEVAILLADLTNV